MMVAAIIEMCSLDSRTGDWHDEVEQFLKALHAWWNLNAIVQNSFGYFWKLEHVKPTQFV